MKGQSFIELMEHRAEEGSSVFATLCPRTNSPWRPAADFALFPEVFLHVAGEHFGIVGLIGTAPRRDSMERLGKVRHRSTRLIEELNKSWSARRRRSMA